jgi:prepilin-type N-terminal cleavage/methylation domain-containing protein
VKAIRARLGIDVEREAGLSLIEVLVAMMIFAVISVGVAFSIVNTLVMTRESRAREVASNLAAQEIDLDRSINDVFSLGDKTWDTTVNGAIFHMARSTGWVSSTGSTLACGTGGGTLQYKQINISVTWAGQSAATSPVRADTLIAPNSRINDPTLGTIIVSVKSASGAGTPGVTVSVTPSAVPNGATALTTTPPVTDADGCSFALKVTPGNYDVTLSSTNYVDIKQNTAPKVTALGVTAGGASTAPFDFDNGALFTLNYASNYTGSVPIRPTNLDTTFLSTVGGDFTTKLGVATSTRLFPFSGGYATIAGAYVPPAGTAPTCINVDPASWTVPAADGAVGQAPQTAAALPGGPVTAKVPMGVVTVSGLTANKYLTAVSQASAPGTGDPGCGIQTVYTFPQLTTTSTTVALPFGSWVFYTGSSSGSTTTPIATSSVSLLTRGILTPTTKIVTLDPRGLVP